MDATAKAFLLGVSLQEPWQTEALSRVGIAEGTDLQMVLCDPEAVLEWIAAHSTTKLEISQGEVCLVTDDIDDADSFEHTFTLSSFFF